MIHIDTHIAIWTHLALRRKLTKAAQKALSSQPIVFSPMLRLELHFLMEKGKLPASSPAEVIRDLVADFGATESPAEWAYVVDLADRVRWTHDPFDRLIVANAMADNAKLVTADSEIVDNFSGAIW